jgi:hypothetical protein
VGRSAPCYVAACLPAGWQLPRLGSHLLVDDSLSGYVVMLVSPIFRDIQHTLFTCWIVQNIVTTYLGVSAFPTPVAQTCPVFP